MDFTKTHLVLLIVSTTLLFAPTTDAVRTTQARVWTICKPTTNPLLCYKTLLPKALSTPKFNMYKAVDVEIEEAQAQVIKTGAKIANSIFTSSDKNIANALTICKEQYGNMVDSLIEVITLVSKRNAVEARFKFSAFISYHSSCEQAFVESKNAIPPFADDAKVVYDLGANILDILKAIEDRETRLAQH